MSDLLLDVRDVKAARKHHQCEWCFKGVKKGEPYRRFAAMSDGEFTVTVFHLECDEAYERERDDEADGDPEGVSWNEHHDRGKTYEETHGVRYD